MATNSWETSTTSLQVGFCLLLWYLPIAPPSQAPRKGALILLRGNVDGSPKRHRSPCWLRDGPSKERLLQSQDRRSPEHERHTGNPLLQKITEKPFSSSSAENKGLWLEFWFSLVESVFLGVEKVNCCSYLKKQKTHEFSFVFFLSVFLSFLESNIHTLKVNSLK